MEETKTEIALTTEELEEPREVQLLLIEDSTGDIDLAHRALRRAPQTDYEVTDARTLGAGLDHLRHRAYDAILLDLHLPDSTGLDTLNKILPLAGAAPVIVFTITDDERIGVEAVRLGAQDYLVKGETTRWIIHRVIRHAIERKKSQDLIRRQAAELDRALAESRELFESAPAGRANVDSSGRFVQVNRALCEMTGYTRDELLTMTFSQLAHPEDRGLDSEQFAAMIRGESPRYLSKKRYVRKDGTTVWVEVMASPVKEPDGHITASTGVIIDITAQVMAEQALKDSERRFRGTFENAPIAASHMDLDGRWIRVNRRFCEILGYSEEELLQKYFADVTPPADFEAEAALMKRLLAGEIPHYSLHKRYFTKEGKTIWLDLVCTLQRDDSGKPEYFIRFAQDITNRVEFEQALKRQADLIDLSPDAIIVRQLDGTITLWSKGAERLYGWTAQEAIGRSTHELLRTGFPQPFEGIVEQVRHTGRWHGELIHHTKDDKELIIESWWLGRPDDLGNIHEILETNVDVTDRKRAEMAMKQVSDELARSNQDLEQFAYVASHDLQEPLRMITGHLKIVHDRVGEELDTSTKESMGFVLDGAARMQDLIRDLLAYSRVGRRTEGFVPTDMEKSLAKALANLRTSVEESDAKVEHGPLPTVQAEPALLTQLLQNLIGNAVKYHAPDRKPVVKVAAVRQDTGWLFSVQDNGIGIPEKHKERIFKVFQRLHTRQQYAGTGIGLAIVKRIVEFHGGRVWVVSTLGEGSTFYFTIPDRARVS